MDSRHSYRQAFEALRSFGRPHKKWLGLGIIGTIGVVACRLALPWPLRGVVEGAFTRGDASALVRLVPTWGEPILWFCVTYVLIAIGAGLAEMLERINMMRFAAHTTHDMRAAAVRCAAAGRLSGQLSTGDLIARIIGDTARTKAGLSGILVHVSNNGLLFVLVCTVMMVVSVELGLLFVVGGLAALGVGVFSARPVAASAGKHRRKEGDYAGSIEAGLAAGTLDPKATVLNAQSAHKDVRTTRLMAQSSLAIHAALGIIVALGLWVGSTRAQPGDVFLFIAYALTVHRRLVQVGRQVARTGKVVASTNRVAELLRQGGTRIERRHVPLCSGLRLAGVKLHGNGGGRTRGRLRRTDLLIEPGPRVAVIGRSGSGTSSLLCVLAGIAVPHEGEILWDETPLGPDGDPLQGRVGFLPQNPVFAKQPAWQVLGLGDPNTQSEAEARLLTALGIVKRVSRLKNGWETGLTSAGLSLSEARTFHLARMLLTDPCALWVLDAPLEGLGRRAAQKRMEVILERVKARCLVVSMTRPRALESFDRVLWLRGGRIRFDGTPEEWIARREAKRVARTSTPEVI